jgi:hypothetical protein
VRRLLQLATITFVMVTLLTPVLECFDRWDGAGLRNDSEFPVFAVMLLLCLVLLVAVILARAALETRLTTVRLPGFVSVPITLRDVWFVPAVKPAGTPPPLRI